MSEQLPEKDQSIQRALGFLKQNRPLPAEEICRDYLKANPGCVDHQRLLAHTLLKQNRLDEAEQQLRFAIELDDKFPHLYEDLGTVLANKGALQEATKWLEKAVSLDPGLSMAHRKLGQIRASMGQGEAADDAFKDYLDTDPDRKKILEGVELLRQEKPDEARPLFREVLQSNPNSTNAMRYLAACHLQNKSNLEDAEALLRRATQLTPDYAGAWMTLGSLFIERNKHMQAVDAFKKVCELEPNNPESWAGLANAYAVAMYPEESAAAFKKATSLNPNIAGIQMGYGHTLKTLGQQDEALKAYRSAIQLRPELGEVYWSMANLKIFKFEEPEVDAMLKQIKREDLTENARVHFHFALGKAFEDRKDYDNAWHHYHSGNQLKRTSVTHEPMEMENRYQSIMEVFDEAFLEQAGGNGFDAPDPIFIIGLPRSGSTLVEQILASHSMVEGTSELPILGQISISIGRYRTDGVFFPEAARDLRKKDWRAYGQQYMEDAERHRILGKPRFTDKLPNNFPYVGLAHLILPNAKIINARRHPFDSCLGGYKQLFGHGQNFTYDMLDLAHYYQQYDAMIRHWRKVLPGKVLDVHYEETVHDLETQVRKILDHCELPFEENCLRYYENERAVKTASSEQVRQPIYTGALGTWRRYDEHLQLWKDQLGYIIDDLPDVARNAGL